MIDRFVKFSVELTAFSEFELRGTGLAKDYLDAVVRVIGEGILGELLDAYDRIQDQDRGARDARLRREIFGDPKLGPIARHIIKIWYIGIWYELPHEWTEAYGASSPTSSSWSPGPLISKGCSGRPPARTRRVPRLPATARGPARPTSSRSEIPDRDISRG